MKKLSIIIPCYNEELVIMESYRRVKKALSPLSLRKEILFVNDGSRDRTRQLLDEIAEEDGEVKVIHFSRNFGHQPAVSAGIKYCDADLAIIMDADMQDPPELIPDLVRFQEETGANGIYCVRKKREDEGFFKRATAKLFYRLMNRMSEVDFPVDTGDFRLIDRKIMDQFCLFQEKGKYIRGLISWVGFDQRPFYYERKARLAGETKYPLKKMLKFALNALLYFSKKPLSLVIGLGFFSILVGLVLGVWFVLGKIYGFSHSESGWTSIMTIIIFFGGVQLLTIGVLGQYIGVLFDETKRRPEYIVDEMKNESGSLKG